MKEQNDNMHIEYPDQSHNEYPDQSHNEYPDQNHTDALKGYKLLLSLVLADFCGCMKHGRTQTLQVL